jgi:D-sedoheptulose 7-phosphate isomerase
LLEGRRVINKINVETLARDIDLASTLIIGSVNHHAPVLVCGNGGSFSDASHFAGELVNQFTRKHRPLPVLTLGSNNTILTAWANDVDYESQFAREFEAFALPNSVLCVFTTSGKSKNILAVLEKAKEIGIPSIGFTSNRGASFIDHLCRIMFVADSDSTPHTQEAHIMMYHALAMAVEIKLEEMERR